VPAAHLSLMMKFFTSPRSFKELVGELRGVDRVFHPAVVGVDRLLDVLGGQSQVLGRGLQLKRRFRLLEVPVDQLEHAFRVEIF